MIVAGIIAEYNPLHSGHIYQIDKIRRDLKVDYVIVAMSGSFVQRGEPAIFDPYYRTKTALMAGADMVVEIPVTGSTASAKSFANAAVKILRDLDVDYICFGSESGDMDNLRHMAHAINFETTESTKKLKANLAAGMPYPKAVADAYSGEYPFAEKMMEGPNNILAIEYILAAHRLNYQKLIHTIKREGSDYSSDDYKEFVNNYSKAQDKASLHPSASMIRQAIKEKAEKEVLNTLLPAFTENTNYIEADDFSLPLLTVLNKISYDELLEISDVNEDIANRITNLVKKTSRFTYTEFVNYLHTKNISRAKASRIATHLLLGIIRADLDLINDEGLSPYIRVLGVRNESTGLLKSKKLYCPAPIICKVNSDSSILDEQSLEAFKKDIAARDLYRMVYYNKYNNAPDIEDGVVII